MPIHTLGDNLYFQPIIAPVSALGSTIQPAGAYIDMSPFDWGAFILMVGVTDRTLTTIQVVQATAAAGTGSKNVSGAINPTFAATDDGKIAIVTFRTADLDINNSFRYVAVTPAATGGTGDLGAILFMAGRARNLAPTQPSTVLNITNV